MPDPEGKNLADEEAVPDSSLHAYKEGRKEDVAGDADKLESTDPQDMQVHELEDEEGANLGMPAHEKK